MLTETISLTTDLEQAYFQYAVETITDRALPRVEDGLKPVQRRILYAMHDMGLRHDRPHKKSVRVVGECFVAGTLITTERGFKPIENVTTGERVRTQQGWQPVTALYEMPERDLLQVTLATGMTNVVTPSQKFKVLTPELEYVWKEARDLTTNDHLVISCQYPEHATYQVIDGPDGPVVLNENLAYWWGQFLSGGWNRVPSPILCSPASVAWAFISGLCDGDGRVHSNRNTIQYSSVSTSLIYQLMTLLQSLSIMSYLHVTPIEQRRRNGRLVQSNHALYSLEARSDCAQLFAPNARPAWQAQRLARMRRSNGKGSHLAEPVCVESSAEHLRLYRSQLTGLGLMPKLRGTGSELADFMEGVSVNRLAFVPVACVAPAPAQRTYDLQVDGDHEFVAHGMVVHNCLGKYHPHGDQSVYMSMVRMGQGFSMRHALIDGQGNYGSIDGDSPAAMRYTEARLAEIAGSVLQDIDQDTVDFVDNFDGSLQEPVILPAALPNLLINGATGIAVGMATNIPPHNLGEVCDAVIYVADRWRQRARITVDELMEIIPGPDFPTGGVIYRYRADSSGEGKLDTIRSAYEGGQGRIVTQARVDMEDIGGGKANIVVTELPYAVQKSTVLERIAREVREGKISGVTDLRDESDHEGMRAVIEVSRVADAREVLESVLSHSQLRETFGVNALALVSEKINGETIVRPQRLSLREMLVYFIEHRLNVIVRRSRYELAKREARLHIVQGLLKALDVIDQVIDTIRRSRTSETAEKNLIKRFKFTPLQAQAILAMQLRRLAALERRKLADEEKELQARIRYLKGLLRSQARRLEVVVEETLAIKEKFATPRKTVILTDEKPGDTIVTEADLSVPDGPQMIVVTTQGVQRADTKLFGYRVKPGTTSRAVEAHRVHLRTEPEDTVVLVSDRGRAWWGAVGRLPRAAGFSELGLHKDERVVAAGLLSDTCCLVLGTRQGRVKRVKAEDVKSSAEASWTTIVGLVGPKDRVLFAGVGDDEAQVMFWGTSYANRFVAGTLNPQATPAAKGVAGIKVDKGNQLLGGAVIGDPTAKLGAVVVSKNGFVKRVPLEMFSVQSRGGRGVQLLNVTEATGPVVAVAVGPLDGSVDLLAADGKRQRLAQVPLTNRANRGKKLIKLDDVIEAVVL